MIARGNERKAIFRGDPDRVGFLERLAECRHRLGFFVYAYCLMDNHVHLLLERGPEPLSRFMAMLLSFYGQWFNRQHRRVGHLFQGRYKSFLVQRDKYLLALLRYIHENPVKAGLVRRARDYRWSSDRFYRAGRGPDWLDLEKVLPLIGDTRSDALATYAGLFSNASTAARADGGAFRRGVMGDEGFALRVLRDCGVLAPVGPHRTAEEIANMVAAVTGLTLEQLRCRGHRAACSEARAIAGYLARRDCGISVARMAKCFRRDESTLVRGVLRLERSIARDERLRERVDHIAVRLVEGEMHDLHD